MKSQVNSSLVTNVDEIEEESSHQKGAKFEKEFAKYMKTNLGYDNAVTKRKVRSAANTANTEVDVIGFKNDPRGKELRMISYICISFALVVFIFKMFYTYDENNTLDSSSNAIILGLVTLFSLGGYFAYHKSKSLERENGWVECKDRKNKSTYDYVQKMFDEFSNYEKSNDTTYKFTELYFVSANGFVDSALQFAKRNNIRCFVKNSDGAFEEI